MVLCIMPKEGAERKVRRESSVDPLWLFLLVWFLFSPDVVPYWSIRAIDERGSAAVVEGDEWAGLESQRLLRCRDLFPDILAAGLLCWWPKEQRRGEGEKDG